MPMTINILCEAEKLQSLKNKLKRGDILNIPLSSDGKLPATHYFCTMQVLKDKAEKLLAMQEYSVIEVDISAKDFLEKHNLQIILK
jgi:hypothetical protein